MARKPATQRTTVPPTMQPHQAIPLIRRQVERLTELMNSHDDEPRVVAWESTTENILNGVYGLPDGEPHSNTFEFKNVDSGAGFDDRFDSRDRYLMRQQKRRALLEAYLEQLQDLAPPAAQIALGQYRFHAEIERVGGQLFRDGHYKQAAFEAYIRVIEEVRIRSGLKLDGDPLMNQAFGCDNRTPSIQFNTLQTDAERDEQKGFMFLFKGIVGLRNSKAHSNRLFNDPSRAHEYLALASVLMRVLEISKP